MAFARKAVVEQRLGKTSVVVLPVPKYVAPLLEAGAEVRLLGRVDWHDVKTGEQRSNGNPIVCFVLRGQRRADPPEGTQEPIG
ncbi:MAG: hypothetical protein ACLQM8_23775 [Limisphaerales bacterium]